MKDREWAIPFVGWNHDLKCEFVSWLVNTYGEKNAHEYFDEFRAVKDVEASVAPQTENTYTDALAHAMMHTKQVMAANLMNKVFEEVYEEHGKALLNEHNQP